MLATTLLMFVLIAVFVSARTFSTLPAIWPAEVLSVMPPWVALRVTLPVPATMLPDPVRLPVARLSKMSPLLVATLVPTARRPFTS